MAPYEWGHTAVRSRNGRAAVLGAGVAGLLTARALADTFEEVMIIERRSGPVVPSVLAQVLSEAARRQLDGLFPGLSAELVADGAAIVVPSRPQPPTASPPPAERADARLQFTQQFIQRHLSRRLKSVDGILTLARCDAVGLVRDHGRCVGVHVLPRSRSAAVRTIPADLVVDAMGAGSRLCLWLNDGWRIGIPSEREQFRTQYASRLYQLRAGSLSEITVIDSGPAHPCRAVVMAVEDSQYVMTVACPTAALFSGDQFDHVLGSLVPPEVAAAIAGSQPAGSVSVWMSAPIRCRRFDRAGRLPADVCALGGSLYSRDPLDGHGFEMAVLEAGILRQLLGSCRTKATVSQSRCRSDTFAP